MNLLLPTFTTDQSSSGRLASRSEASWYAFTASLAGKGFFVGGYSGLRQGNEIEIHQGLDWEELPVAEGHPQQRSGRYRKITVPI